MTNNEMTITIELNGVPVIKREIIDMAHERPQPEPQLSEERRSSSNNKIIACCCILMIVLFMVGLFGGYILGKDDGKDIYAVQFEDAAIEAAHNFATMAKGCGWTADIEEGVEIDDYEGAFIDVRVEKDLGFGVSLRYNVDVCVHPGSTSYEVNGKSYDIDEWKEALTQYGKGRDYDGVMPEPVETSLPSPKPSPKPNPTPESEPKPDFERPDDPVPPEPAKPPRKK